MVFLSNHPMPDWLTAIILGIVEGVTEFLPVSSTGHLLIADHLLPNLASYFRTDLFNVVIQCGAVLAVLPLFPQRLNQFIHRWREPATRDYLGKILLAFCITGVIGLIAEKKLKLPEELKPVAWALLIGGILFVAVELWLCGKTLGTEVTWTIAAAVGLGQLLAVIFPGTSRSGATILLALLLGLGRPAATEFSFLVGIPTMLAAGGYKIFKALHHPDSSLPPENWAMVGLTTVVAAMVSFVAVKWLLRYVQTHTFLLFGWYRIAVGLAIFLFLCSPKSQPSAPSHARVEQPVLAAR
jgi:undecaprenyl-diphosphatase